MSSLFRFDFKEGNSTYVADNTVETLPVTALNYYITFIIETAKLVYHVSELGGQCQESFG